MGVVIKVDEISKLFRLGKVGTGTLSHDLRRWWALMRGEDDPHAKIGSVNDRSRKGNKDEYVWALRDINFQVHQGDVVGIIGKNGAGKSTLLKILSRITAPTKGSIRLKGRVASLLEVGTGFHPELTGRENIFMNGTLLGMTRKEIQGKLDEIIDFAGVALYIDTPVKRYSTGMQVRLGFAVAAFLEPEILVVDEVLAVGDAEFQKKAIGRMQEVSSGDGRTILFVSHNLAAVNSLCRTGMLLDKGRVQIQGPIDDVIHQYHASNRSGSQRSMIWPAGSGPSNGWSKLISVEAVNLGNGNQSISTDDSFAIKISYESLRNDARIGLTVLVKDANENMIFGSINNHEQNYYSKPMLADKYASVCVVPKNLFNAGNYSIGLIMFGPNFTDALEVSNILEIEIMDGINVRGDFHGTYAGVLRPLLKWETFKI